MTLFHFSPAGKSEHLPFYVFEKTRVSCYKLLKENKSIKLQMLALKKIIINITVEFKTIFSVFCLGITLPYRLSLNTSPVITTRTG